VADSGHHRVLVLDGTGNVLHTIGSGLAGHREGAFGEAAFDDPQGVVWRGENELFVADARAHTVSRLDLAAKTVTTVAGTGELGEAPIAGISPATKTPLRSPWDLCFVGDALYVALAGSHQIGRIDLAAGTVARAAGNGVESIVDGPFDRATFSQPSGLALVGDTLYVADSETSSVRELDLTSERVRTVIGVGLFDFGDVDGPPSVARLQHDIGIAADPEGRLVVADTYNHKLKVVDRTTGDTRTFAVGFSEPAGLAWDPVAGGWIVADTNHHALVRVSADGRTRTPLEVRGAPEPARGRLASGEPEKPGMESSWFSTLLRPAHGRTLGPGAARLVFEVSAPPGKKIALGSPLGLTVEVSRRSDVLVLEKEPPRLEGAGLPVQPVVLDMTVRPFSEARIEAEVIVRVDCVICDAVDDVPGEAPAVCEPYRAWIRLPVPLSGTGGDEMAFEPA
jgi:DNA-binding beta-propeller fold protein YncE